MKYYARIENNIVFEIICLEKNADIKNLYHPDFIFIECDKSVKIGMIKDGKVFTQPLPTPELTIDERRAAMVISKVKAMQNLKKVGKLNAVLDLMDTLPRDNDVRILWDFSENLRRNDATLVKVCKDQLGLDDLGIDNLFTQP